jgi:hypothetical protein
LVQSLLL